MTQGLLPLVPGTIPDWARQVFARARLRARSMHAPRYRDEPKSAAVRSKGDSSRSWDPESHLTTPVYGPEAVAARRT